MTFREAMTEIEGLDFAVRVNVASDYRTFVEAVRRERAVATAYEQMGSSENCQRALLRIFELSQQDVDLRFENQWDTALAVYVWLTHKRSPDLGKMAAAITVRAPQTWWAEKMCRKILLEEVETKKAGVQPGDFVQAELVATYTSKETRTDQFFMVPRLEAGISPQLVTRVSIEQRGSSEVDEEHQREGINLRYTFNNFDQARRAA